MEIVNLKKYLTPLERPSQDVRIDVELGSQQTISGSGFYEAIFKRDVEKLHKRLFKIKKEGQLVSVVSSLIPDDVMTSEQLRIATDVEESVDLDNNVDRVAYDIMLTWPNDEEHSLFDNQQELQQILLKKVTIKNKERVIRYEEEAMLPDRFSLQKGK